jgi:AraC-like DNA-binding protein
MSADTTIPLVQPGSALGYGLEALRRELTEQGVDPEAWLEASGVDPSGGPGLVRPLRHRERFALLRNAERLAARPDTALRAGRRQRISDFGLFGYAMVTSRTFGDAFEFGREHLELAGPVLRITFELRGDVGVLRSHDAQALGSALPFVAEFWRSSMSAVLGHVLGSPFPTRAMFFPYPAPPHADAYRDTFRCPVHFASDVMEWHFDASVMDRPCPNASDVMARVCQDFCERVVSGGDGDTDLERQVRTLCLARPGYNPAASEVAAALGLSLRTFYRRLRDEDLRYQTLLDETRLSVAVEYLENTRMPIDEIGRRLGFADASNFRKAFRRWAGRSPSEARRATAHGAPGQQVRIGRESTLQSGSQPAESR